MSSCVPATHRRARGERARSPPAKLAMARMGSPTVRKREHLRSAACCLSFRPLLRLEPGTKGPVDLLPERLARRIARRAAPLLRLDLRQLGGDVEVEGEPQLRHFGAKRFEGGVLQLRAEIEQEMIVPQREPRHRNDRPTAGLLEPTPAAARASRRGVELCLAFSPAAVAVVTPRDCAY